MRITITAGANVYLISGESHAHTDGNFQGRLLNEINLSEALNTVGAMPVTLNLSIRNDDGYILRSVDLWAATVEIEADGGQAWAGKITAYDNDADGILRVVATERAAPEIEIQIPDEVARLVTVDENFHTSAVNVTLPLVVGGTVAEPHLIKGILIDKTAGIYLLCVGEIHQVVKVYRGTEELSIGYDAYTGTALQASYAGIAYVQITDEDLLFNDDGSYVEISAEVVGVKLGASTIEECRNGARFLQYLLTTAATGACGWGLGIASEDLDSTSFTTAISRLDTAGLKLDGVFYFRQTAQAWIDQICQAIRGSYSIGGDGKRRLFVNASGSSVKTYDESNMRVLRDGKGAYTGRVYNKGKLDYGYNPITGQFMQSAQYENSTSIAAIGEQEFYGQSYLIKDATTAQAILEYNCKKSLIGADKVLFETDELAEGCRVGDIITLAHTTKGLTGTYQITSLEMGDYLHTIEAEKYSTDIFTVGTPGTTIDWATDAPIASSIFPGNPSGLNLSTVVDYDSDGDGAARPWIEGTFTPPEGKYLGAAVFWGEGEEPATWNAHGSIRGTSFRVGPVKSGQLYTVKVQLFNSSGASGAISATITPGKHADLPPTPTISVQPGFGCIVVSIGVEDFTALAEFEIQRRKSDGSGLTIVTQKHRSTRLVDDSPEILTNYTLAYQYQVRSVSNSRQFSAWSAWSDSVSPVQVQSKDITDLPIIGKQFLTAEDVGEEVDGVKFTAAGIEMWEDGVRKVFIPVTGDPVFNGTITALAGYIGECVIADGGLRSADFVSQHRGWNISKYGNAEFNNLRARGAIETAVFRKDEISVVGGKTLIRPAAVVEDYDYAAYLDEVAEASFEAYWAQLDELLDETIALPAFMPPADYDEFYATELDYWMQLSEVLVTGVFATVVTEADFSSATQQAALAAHWAQLDELLDESVSVPTFPYSTFAAYEQIEIDGWMQLNDMLDLDVFEPAIGANDTRLYLDYAADFAAGDVVRLKNETNDYWAVIASVGADYVDLSQRSGAIFDITPGQAVVNYGKAGSGGILLDGQSPLIDLFSHAGEPWNGTDLLVRQGNLNGWGGINTDVYGLAIGTPESDYILAIPGQGIFLNAKIQISGGAGIANLTDAGAAALADDLDGIGDGATYKRTTANEKAGAGRAYSGLDTNNRLITAVIPATAVSPSGSGLYMGSNYMGFYNSGWKTYMDSSGNFALVGSGAHGLSWNAGTGVLTVNGDITVQDGAITSAKITTGQIVGKDIRTATNAGNGTVSGLKLTSSGLEAWNGATRTVFIQSNGAASFSGVVSCGSGSSLAGFTATATDLTAGSGSTAIGISTDTAKLAFWAGSATPSSAPFRVSHAGSVVMTSGFISGMVIDSNQLAVGSTGASDIVKLDGANKRIGWLSTSIGTRHAMITMSGFHAHYSYSGVTTNAYMAPGTGATASDAPVYVVMQSNSRYGVSTDGRVYAEGGYYPTSDERCKSEIEDVSVLNSLRQIRVKKYHLDDYKIAKIRHEKELLGNLKSNNVIASKSAFPSEPEIENYNPCKSIGVIAQDFNKAFGIGNNNEETYNLTDAIGVALRAIQELAEIVDDLKAENAELRAALKLPEKQKKQANSIEFTAEDIEKAADSHVKAAYENLIQIIAQ